MFSRMIKNNHGSLNLELALLIMLVALAVASSINFTGGKIATRFSMVNNIIAGGTFAGSTPTVTDLGGGNWRIDWVSGGQSPYAVESSPDGNNWTKVVDKDGSDTNLSATITAVPGTNYYKIVDSARVDTAKTGTITGPDTRAG